MYQRDSKKKVRIGIVGAGSHTYRNLLPALHFLPVELVAICNRGQDKLDRTIAEYRCAGYTNPEEMYEKEDLDGVILAVSPYLHPKLACQAMAHGLHVFIEKPVSPHLAGVDEIIASANQHNRIVVAGYKKAFMPATQKIKEILSSGKAPSLTTVVATYPLLLPQDGVASLARGEFSEWMKNGCHPLSLLVEVVGNLSWVQTLVNEKGLGIVHMEFNNGVLGTIHLVEGEKPARDQYHFFGDGWSLQLDCSHHITFRRGIPLYQYETATDYAGTGFEGGDQVWSPVSCQASPENNALFVQGMVQELDHFCQCILENQAPTLGNLAFTRHLTQVFEEALRSQGLRREIP